MRLSGWLSLFDASMNREAGRKPPRREAPSDPQPGTDGESCPVSVKFSEPFIERSELALRRSSIFAKSRRAASSNVSNPSLRGLLMTSNMQGKVSEMHKSTSEKSEMSSVEFVQDALRYHVAPPGSGVSVGDRIRIASRRLGWGYSRTRDAWYADPRISISADELRSIEDKTGLRYGRKELTTINELIGRADALLDGPEADFYRPFVDAVRAMARAFDRSGTPGGR